MDSNKIPKHIIIVQPLEMESCSLNCIEIKKNVMVATSHVKRSLWLDFLNISRYLIEETVN